MPGARELRILCDTFWVPTQWLLFGTVDLTVGGVDSPSARLIQSLQQLILSISLPDRQARVQQFQQEATFADTEKGLAARRRRLLWEAMNPAS